MTDAVMEALFIRPFLDFAESWEKHKMAIVILYSISLVLGYSDEALFPPGTAASIYWFVTVFLSSSALMLIRPKKMPAFPWSIPFEGIAWIWVFSVLGAICLELALAIRAIMVMPVWSFQGMAALAFFVIPTLIAIFKGRKK
ncbi:MAG: hypothetical protein V1861_03110 [Candidatus Micrarchaeota archaeon]